MVAIGCRAQRTLKGNETAEGVALLLITNEQDASVIESAPRRFRQPAHGKASNSRQTRRHDGGDYVLEIT